MRGGEIHDRILVILWNASMKRNGQLETTYTSNTLRVNKSTNKLIYHAKINSILVDQLSNAISPPSCFSDIIVYSFACHWLNVQKVFML